MGDSCARERTPHRRQRGTGGAVTLRHNVRPQLTHGTHARVYKAVNSATDLGLHARTGVSRVDMRMYSSVRL